MPELRWTLASTYHDTEHNFRAVGPGVYDVPEDRVEKYLSHRLGGWERVDDEPEEPEQEAEDDEESVEEHLEDGKTRTLPFTPEEHTNPDIEEKVQEIDDEEVLIALRTLEEEQQDRTGATDAIEARLDEVREG